MATNKTPTFKIQKVIEALEHSWDTMWEQERRNPPDRKREEELHPSSFPYCGYRHAMGWLNVGADPDEFVMGAHMMYYVTLGTSAHLVFQELIGKLTIDEHEVQGEMVGDWQCTNPKCGHLVEFSTYVRCPKCDSDTRYEELGVTYGKRTHGHLDGLFRIKYRGKYLYFVIDYKTSSVKAVEFHRMSRKLFPYTSNKFQIRSYTAYLEQKYGIEINGWVLIYAARDTPMKAYSMVGAMLDDNDRKWIARYVKVSDKLFHAVRKKIAVKQVEEEPKLIDALCKYKLCPTQEFYREQVYDKYDPCPHGESGACFSAPKRFLVKAIREHNKRESEADED